MKQTKTKPPKKGLALVAFGMSPLDSGLPSASVCPGQHCPQCLVHKLQSLVSWAASGCAELPCVAQRTPHS